jgi:protein-disulfide isomerase
VLAPRNSAQPGTQAGIEKAKGPVDAPVLVEEYSDFQCPYCRQFATGAGRRLEEEFVQTGKVRFIFRHFAFLGPESQWAAEASECANEQGMFWDFHDKLFDEWAGENAGAFSKDNLRRFAADLGMNTEAFNRCIDGDRYADLVRQETQDGVERGVRGTPTLFINGQYVEGGADYEVLREAIEAALSGSG